MVSVSQVKDIHALQRMLWQFGYRATEEEPTPNGKLSGQTKDMLKIFQNVNTLKVSGKLDKRTLQLIWSPRFDEAPDTVRPMQKYLQRTRPDQMRVMPTFRAGVSMEVSWWLGEPPSYLDVEATRAEVARAWEAWAPCTGLRFKQSESRDKAMVVIEWRVGAHRKPPDDGGEQAALLEKSSSQKGMLGKSISSTLITETLAGQERQLGGTVAHSSKRGHETSEGHFIVLDQLRDWRLIAGDGDEGGPQAAATAPVGNPDPRAVWNRHKFAVLVVMLHEIGGVLGLPNVADPRSIMSAYYPAGDGDHDPTRHTVGAADAAWSMAAVAYKVPAAHNEGRIYHTVHPQHRKEKNPSKTPLYSTMSYVEMCCTVM
jgi:hypothetical protein